ncbi:MAG: hypothetical protein K6E75_11705 [Lachnospiraceae bacterium]|nr:hypothetical protein [Lachnospiraceae bacterium]
MKSPVLSRIAPWILHLDTEMTLGEKTAIQGSSNAAERFMKKMTEKGLLTPQLQEAYEKGLSSFIRSEMIKTKTKEAERIAFLEAI